MERSLPKRKFPEFPIAILTVTSPIVINVPTRGLLVAVTKDSFVLRLAKFKYQYRYTYIRRFSRRIRNETTRHDYKTLKIFLLFSLLYDQFAEIELHLTA